MARANLLERGILLHRGRVTDVAAVSVQIVAGNEVIEVLNAVPGRHEFQSYSTDEFVGTAEAFDWIVAEQDLVFNGVKKQPVEGWLVKWQLPEGRTAVYRVTPAGAPRCFDTMDQLGILYRLHTNLIAIEG